MFAFILFAFVLLLLALLLLMPGLLGRHTSEVDLSAPGVERRSLNVGLLRDRLTELDSELANGLLTEDQHEQAREELQRDLLLNEQGDVDNLPSNASDGRWLGWVVVILLPLGSVLFYLQVGETRILTLPPEAKAESAPAARMGSAPTRQAPPAPAPAMAAESSAAPDAMGDMATLTEKLATKLAANPENADGWMLLARSYSMQERYAEAAGAYAKAHALVGDQVNLLSEYAEALLLASPQGKSKMAASFIARTLELDPNEPRALWLSGIIASRRGDKELAIAQWERLLGTLKPDDNMRAMVEKRLARLKGESSGWEVVTQPETAAVQPVAPKPAAASSVGLPVTVSVAPELANSYNPAHTLFIFARAPGQRMPIAIQRHSALSMPLTASLSDNDVMVAGQSLANYPKLEIVARISQSGSAMVQAGDIEGVTLLDLSQAVGEVDVTIDTRR